MKSIYLLLADEDTETQGIILAYFKEEYNIFLNTSFNNICKEPFLDSSVAIIDYSFAGNKGLEVLKMLKIVKPFLPVMFITSHNTEDICLNAFRLGTRDYFKKPLVVEDIARSIKLILSCRNKKKSDRINLLLDKYANEFVTNTTSQYVHPNIERSKIFIENNYSSPISLHLIADTACMSKHHFCRAFKKQVGMTCIKYLNIIRIREAKKLLKNSLMSITEICFLIGYNDLTYFERVFKSIEGITPRSYRK